jgi:Na+-translocating ferredoxin:NAD+ oxidoreductase subunit C
MKTVTFLGGVHPAGMKQPAAAKASLALPAGKLVVVLLSQHAGKPAIATVRKGDRVLLGQMIGVADGLISASIHAPVSGTVRAVEPFEAANGASLPAIHIENDGRDERHHGVKPAKPHWDDFSPEEVREAVREAGIVGLGGAAFPTAVKLTPPREYPIDTVIVNGAECEPYLTTDHRLLLEHTKEIIDGAEIVRRTVGAKNALIAIEDNKPDAISRFLDSLRGRTVFSVVSLRTKYPQGGEKMLIRALLKRDVPAGGLPFHVGALVQNVATLVAIHRALSSGMPLVERMLTVSGSGISQPKNLWVRIGTLLDDVIAGCGGIKGNPQRLIMGGPMMGTTLWTSATPIVKATSGILLLDDPADRAPEFPCIRCNRCSRTCPMNLVPTRIVNLIRIGEIDEAREWGMKNCMECGTCAYACPAAIPLVAWIRLGKYENLRRAKKSGGAT